MPIVNRMTHTTRTIRVQLHAACAVAALLSASSTLRGAEVDHARDLLREWVQTETLLSEEEMAWREQEAELKHLLELYQKECEMLRAQIDTVRQASTEAETKRSALKKEEAQLKTVAADIRKQVVAYEANIFTLIDQLPNPLQKEVHSLTRRIPTADEAEPPSLAKRTQILVGILKQLDTFNGAVTVSKELRKTEDGKQLEVSTIYFGLATAYFVDQSGGYAGIGVPSSGGWAWDLKTELGPAIQKMLAIYENEAPARFLTLPAKIETEDSL